ncbi:hypothetical protein [Leptospira interrogans]|uniref:hypothetical protein n=1 Tax=Leptospira interrogans TaxID=173 RepID=UPI00051A7576|nr:hypothetical protein [Leptospira interrogans]WOT13276.1 hypothetical protein CFY92_0020855 [Leptospira interrogans]
MRGTFVKQKLQFRATIKIMILAFFTFGHLGCIGLGSRIPPYKPITNTDRSYVKFNFKVSDKEISNSNFALMIYWYNKELIFYEPFLLNPHSAYWVEKYHLKDTGVRVGKLYEGCDYRMPAPLGKRRYEFLFVYFHNNSPKQTVKLEKVIDLPPNHSIRLNVVPAKLPYPNPKDWTQKIENNNAPEVEIIAIVEPNPEPDEDKPCEIPKD